MALAGSVLGQRIRDFRKERGLTQRQLAAQLEGKEGSLNPIVVSRWERGEARPSNSSLRQLVGMGFEISVEEILDGTGK